MSKKYQIKWLKGLPEYDQMAGLLGEYDDERDRCGAEGDWKSKFVPRIFYGIDINVAAYIHDYFYSVGGGATDRFKADAMFLGDLMKQIELVRSGRGWFWLRHLARLRAIKYFEALRAFGDKAFNSK